uniref:Major facilitator superfamily (MFS) profile domain-containing protein n=1 Tax=Panagrolaimus davidi TaxID=227884 RepID=A0A914P0A9_9BILA
MIALNFTLICMFHPAAESDPFINLPLAAENLTTTNEHGHPKYAYTQHEKSMLMWAVAIGSMAATFPLSVLYSKFGARYVFFTAGLVSAISTLLIPAGAEMGLSWFLALRVLQGIAYAADFAAIGVLCARWASLKQNGMFISILTCFSTISSSITNPVAGALFKSLNQFLCESQFGWPSVYYTHGAASVILFGLWVFFYTDHPATHKSVSSTELEKIHRNKTEAHINMDSFIPYKKICTNPVILSVWFCALADIGSGIFLLTYTPTYIKNVLKYGVEETGWLGALPALSHIPIKLGTGYFSDKVKTFNERTKMVAFNSLALFIPGIMFAGLGFIPDEYPLTAVLIFTIIHAFMGANCGGFYKCGTLVSRQYSAFVISNIQFIKCLTLFLAPGLVAIFVSDDSNKSQWRTVFMVLAVTLVIANTIFIFMATDEPAEFTNITRETAKLHKLEKKQRQNTDLNIPSNLQQTSLA